MTAESGEGTPWNAFVGVLTFAWVYLALVVSAHLIGDPAPGVPLMLTFVAVCAGAASFKWLGPKVTGEPNA